MLRTLAGEGVAFDDMLIDRTFESDDAPTRKPRTGMFGRYTDGSYDLGASYVVGDRATDILLARNLGAKGILLAPAAEGRRMLREAGAEEACVLITDSWAEIAEYIRRGERRGRRDARNARNANHRTARPRRPGLRHLRDGGERNGGERNGGERNDGKRNGRQTGKYGWQ